MFLEQDRMMRFLTVGASCVALGVALASYLQARALAADVAALRETVMLLSAAAAQDRGAPTVRTVIERHVVAHETLAPEAPRHIEPSAAERFDGDGSRDPRRRSDLLGVMRNASLEVDSIECNSTTCVMTATQPVDSMPGFIDATSEAIGPGVQLEMVYDPEIAGSRRVTIYAR